MSWVLDHLPDLDSDFAVFYGVDDISGMDAPQFFQRAHRVSAYGGVITTLLMHQEEKRESRTRDVARRATGDREVSVQQMALANPGLISFGKGGR